MDIQATTEKYKKTAKNLTLIGAVLLTIVTLLSGLQVTYLIALRNTDLSKIKELTAAQATNIEESITSSTVLFFAAIALIYLFFTACMYVFSSRIKKGRRVSVLPYYGGIVLLAYSFLQSALAVNLFNAVLYFISGAVLAIALFFVYKIKA